MLQVKIDAAHVKEDRTKQRIAKSHADILQTKDKIRKNALVMYVIHYVLVGVLSTLISDR